MSSVLKIAVLMVLFVTHLFSQTEYKISNTETIVFDSELLGEKLEIIISYPFGYSKSKTNYPVLLILDADVMFGITSQIPQLMSFEKSVSPFIQVGIAYGGGFRNWLKKRNRDYNPSNTDFNDKGALLFLSVIEKELIPFIQKTCRVNEFNLYGHSSGGLFSLIAYMQAPKLFKTIIASSPSVEWGENWFINHYKTTSASETNLYISLGDKEETVLKSLNPVVSLLKEHNSKLSFQIYKNQTHMSVISSAFTDGIKHTFPVK